MKAQIARKVLLFLTPLGVIWGCGGGDGGGGTGPEQRVPTTIQIANNVVTLAEAGETRQLTFTVRDQNGTPITNPSTTFASSDTNVASVSGSASWT